MRRRTIVLFAISVLLVTALAVALLIPLPRGGSGDYAKVLVIRMDLDRDTAVMDSAVIRYGHAPTTAIRTGTLRAELLAGDGSTLRTIPVWDPRVQMGDSADAGGNLTANLSRRTSANLDLVLPYTGKEKGFRLSDPAGHSLVSENLSPAAENFSRTYPKDPEVSGDGQFMLPRIPPALLTAIECAVFVGLVVALILMMRQKR